MLPSAQAVLNKPKSEKFNNEPPSLELTRIQGTSGLESQDMDYTWNEIETTR